MEINRKYVIATIDKYSEYKDIFRKLTQYTKTKNEFLVLSDIFHELERFCSDYKEETSIIFGEHEPPKIEQNPSDTPYVFIQSLKQYTEKIIKDFGYPIEYAFIVDYLNDLLYYLNKTIYEIKKSSLWQQ
jgi:hypothetical protein